MHGLPVSCPFNFPNGNLKQQLSHIGVFICYQNIDAKNKLNLHIYGIHLLNPHKTVVSHLKTKRTIAYSNPTASCLSPRLKSTGNNRGETEVFNAVRRSFPEVKLQIETAV